MTVGKKVLRLAEALGLTQTALADVMSISRGSVASYSARNNANPSRDKVAKLVEFAQESGLAVPMAWFYDGQDTPVPAGQSTLANERDSAVRLNEPQAIYGFAMRAAIRSWSSAMAGIDGEDGAFEEEPEPYEVPTAFLIGGTAKIDLHDIVRITGTSMEPRIEPGERVIFYRDSAIIDNSIALVQSPDHQVYVKAIKREGKRYRFDSLGKGACFDDLTNWTILGHAICIMGRPGEGKRNIEWDDGRYLRA